MSFCCLNVHLNTASTSEHQTLKKKKWEHRVSCCFLHFVTNELSLSGSLIKGAYPDVTTNTKTLVLVPSHKRRSNWLETCKWCYLKVIKCTRKKQRFCRFNPQAYNIPYRPIKKFNINVSLWCSLKRKRFWEDSLGNVGSLLQICVLGQS